MKRTLVLLLALLPLGCNSGQQRQLADCVFDAELSYPAATWLPDDARQSYVWLCMAAHGYRLSRAQKSCGEKSSSAPDLILFAQCYEPMTRFTSVLRTFELAWDR